MFHFGLAGGFQPRLQRSAVTSGFPAAFPKEAEAPPPSRARSLGHGQRARGCPGVLFSQPSREQRTDPLGWPSGFPVMDKEIFLCYSFKLCLTNKNYSLYFGLLLSNYVKR